MDSFDPLIAPFSHILDPSSLIRTVLRGEGRPVVMVRGGGGVNGGGGRLLALLANFGSGGDVLFGLREGFAVFDVRKGIVLAEGGNITVRPQTVVVLLVELK